MKTRSKSPTSKRNPKFSFLRVLRSREVLNHSTLLVGILLIALLAISDYLWPGAKWWNDHPMTATAISTVLFFVAITMLLEGWIRNRQAKQLEKISTVAYRSIAQHVNDIGRNLLAPMSAIDLDELGIPRIWPETQQVISDRLSRLQRELAVLPKTGSWNNPKSSEFHDIAALYIGEPCFQKSLFLCSAKSRRLLHDATAMWAPTMLVSTATSSDLGRLRDITDSLELLQELTRPAVGDTPTEFSDDELKKILDSFWEVISCYKTLRDDYGDQAALPSDEIVDRELNQWRR